MLKRFLFLSALAMVVLAMPFSAAVLAKQPRPDRHGVAQKSPPLQAPDSGNSQKGSSSQPQPPAAPPPQAAPPEEAPAGPALDKLGASLKQIETSLESQSVTDQELQNLRQRLDPVARAIGAVIDRLTPRLGAFKDRLDQLGPKPAEGAPPESPAVTEERDNQQKLYNDTDELLKRARLLAVQADQTAAEITARRRALFTRSLFQRAASIANPAIWAYVWKEAPGDAAAIKSAFEEWLDALNERVDGQHLILFWGAIGLIVLLYIPLSRLALRVLARDSTVEDPGRFRKILAAWWIALVIAVPAAAIVFCFSLLLQYLDLSSTRFQPLLQASGGALLRVAAAAGIARGLFAPTRANWRLPKANDSVASGLVRMAVGLALVASAIQLFDAMNEITGASLPVAVSVHGLVALLGAIAISVELWRFGNFAGAEDCLGPKIGNGTDWFDLLRAAAWIAAFVIFVSVLLGYAAFGSFLVAQFFWAGAVACVWYMLVILTEEAISAGFTFKSRFGRRLVSITGVPRNSLELAGVLISGAMKLALFGLAAILVLAPWGVQSSDVSIDLRAALSGFKVGETTVYPVSIFIAAGIFALALAAVHAVVNWTDSTLLPRMNCDVGLRNSIRTSLSYVGFIIAVSLALSYLGVSFEKLALVAGALSVGIGFGLQSIVNNFVSGLILLWERTVRVGDWIAVGSDQGFVRRISVRATEIETFDRSQVIIPNASLVAGVVTNLVRNDRTARIVIPLTVVASADPEKVREVLIAIAKANPLVLSIPTPQVLFTGMSASALNFELRAFVADVETMYRVKSDLHFAIFKRFKEEKFLETPPPDTTKIEIAGFDEFGRMFAPADNQLGQASKARRGGLAG